MANEASPPPSSPRSPPSKSPAAAISPAMAGSREIIVTQSAVALAISVAPGHGGGVRAGARRGAGGRRRSGRRGPQGDGVADLGPARRRRPGQAKAQGRPGPPPRTAGRGHPAHHRRRLGQGRRGQIHGRGQPRAGVCGRGAADRHARRRPLWAVDPEAARHRGQARGARRRHLLSRTTPTGSRSCRSARC